MKITKIAAFAVTALAAFVLPSCVQIGPEEEPVAEPSADFTVAKGDIEAEYAEVIVRHSGAEDVTWYGFVTEDVSSNVQDLVDAEISKIDRNHLHIGKSQTVAVRGLREAVNYRYIAFAVDAQNAYFGTAGSLVFNTSPKFNVDFTAEVAGLSSHEVTVNLSHNGHEVLTYTGFLTKDTETMAEVLAAEDFATKVTNGKLNPDVTLMSGKTLTVNQKDLEHETAYRYIVYGIFDNDGVVINYGTPGECSFTTPIDLSIVSFNAVISGITKNSADADVTYNAKQEDLTWFGFVTKDLQADAAALISARAASVTPADMLTGAQKVAITGLDAETKYRYIAFGINAEGVFGIPADVQFTSLSAAYDATVFSAEASEITSHSATITVTHTGLEEFEWFGFFTDDLTSALSDVEVPANADQNLSKGKKKVITEDNLTPMTTYRYVVVGRVYGNEYGTRGEAIFTTLDSAVAASYEDFLGTWAMTEGTPYEFTVSKKVAGQSYTVSGLNGAETAKYGIGTPLVVEARYENGKLTIASQDISEPYVDPDDGNTYTDKFCGRYVASDGSKYFDSKMGRVIVTFAMQDTGNIELRPGTTEDGESYIGMRFYQVPPSGSAYAQDNFETVLPNVAIRGAEPTEAYKKWIGNWSIDGTVYTISKGVTNQNYVMGSFYSGFNVSAVVDFDATTGDILFIFGETGQSVTASGGATYDLYKAGSYNGGYMAYGDEDGVICRFILASGGNSASIKPVTYDYNGATITPEIFGIFGYNGSSWANFGMTIGIPIDITRATSTAGVSGKPASGNNTIRPAKKQAFRSFVK